MQVITTRTAYLCHGTKDRAGGRNAWPESGLKEKGFGVEEKFSSLATFLGSDSPAGSGKGGQPLAPSYHNLCIHGVCIMPDIQSTHGAHWDAPFSLAPLPSCVAATVLGLLSELRVPMLIITSVF